MEDGDRKVGHPTHDHVRERIRRAGHGCSSPRQAVTTREREHGKCSDDRLQPCEHVGRRLCRRGDIERGEPGRYAFDVAPISTDGVPRPTASIHSGSA